MSFVCVVDGHPTTPRLPCNLLLRPTYSSLDFCLLRPPCLHPADNAFLLFNYNSFGEEGKSLPILALAPLSLCNLLPSRSTASIKFSVHSPIAAAGP